MSVSVTSVPRLPAVVTRPTLRVTEMSDADIVSGLCEGIPAAERLLVERLEVAVDGTALRVLGRRDADLEDVVQNAFEQIVTSLVRGRLPAGCSLVAWARAITAHVAISALRRRARDRRWLTGEHDPDAAPATWRGPEADATLRQDVELLRRALAGVDEEKAEAVFLHDVLGHELTEIATLTGVSVAAAQSRLVRGRKALQERLAKLSRGGAR